MKKLLFVSLLLSACHGSNKPYKLPELDQAKMKLDYVTIQQIQADANNQAKPFLDEREFLRKKNCLAAKIPLESCQVNLNTGILSEAPKVPTGIPNPSTKK